MEEPEHSDILPPCGGEADSDPEEEGMGDGKHCTLLLGSTHPWKRQDGTYLPRRQSEWVEETQLASSNSMKEDNMENGADQKTSHIPEDPRSEEEEPKAKKVKMDTSVMVCDDDEDDDACMACVVHCEDPVMVECGHCFFRSCADKAQENLGIFLCPECKKVVTKKRTERALPYIKCKDHDETLKLYCVDDGDLCCVICRDSLKHNGHRFLHITDAVGVYEAELSSIMNPLVEAWKKTSELTSQQREKIEELQNTRTEYRQYIMSEFGNLYSFLKGRREELLGQLQEQNKNLLEEMKPNAAKLKKCRDFIIETLAECKQKTYEIDPFSFLDGIKEFLEKCREQKKLLPHNQVTEKELCRATFSGPLQYFAWKQMKSIVPVPECEEQPVTLKQEEVHESPMDQEPTSITHSVTVCHMVANTDLSEMERPEQDTAKNNSTVAECEQQLVTVTEAPTAGALRRYGKDGTRRTLWDVKPEDLSAPPEPKKTECSPVTLPVLEIPVAECEQQSVTVTGANTFGAHPQFGKDGTRRSLWDVKPAEHSPPLEPKTTECSPITPPALNVPGTKEIWILGTGQMTSVNFRAEKCPLGLNLGFDRQTCTIRWFSLKDSCTGLFRKLHLASEVLKSSPDIVLCHFGSNVSKCDNFPDLLEVIKSGVNVAAEHFPEAQFILSTLYFHEKECDQGLAKDLDDTEELANGPRWFSSALAEYAESRRFGFLAHDELQKMLLARRSDPQNQVIDNNLTDTENDLFITCVRGSLKKSMTKVSEKANESSSSEVPVAEPKQIWIIGDEYILNAGVHAEKENTQNLDLDVQEWKVHWLGRTSWWSELIIEMQALRGKLGLPSVVYLHMGSLDMKKFKYYVVIQKFKSAVDQLVRAFPKTQFVISTILPRMEWMKKAQNKFRKLVNNFFSKHAAKRKCHVAHNHNLEELLVNRFQGHNVLRKLDFEENQLFVKNIADDVKKAIHTEASDLDLSQSGVVVTSPGQSDDGCPAGETGSMATSDMTSSGPSSSMALAPGLAVEPGNSPENVSLVRTDAGARDADHPCDRPPQDSPCVVLIIGSTFIVWAAHRAAIHGSSMQLGLPERQARLKWAGVRGLQWSELRAHTLAKAREYGAPGVLVLHTGGNDLGKVSVKGLIKSIRRDLLFFLGQFPGLVIVWSAIIPRFKLKNDTDLKAVNKVRIKISNSIARFVESNGGLVARHVDLEGNSAFFKDNGIFVNEAGIDVFNVLLQEKIEIAIERWRSGKR